MTEQKRPDQSGIALLQARHLYNDARIVAVEHGGGYTIGKDTLTIKVNRLAWGYFEQSILNVLKERQDLRDWAPELVQGDQPCPSGCGGKGYREVLPGTEEHETLYKFFYQRVEGTEYEEDAPPKDKPINLFCKNCQGTGLVLKPQPEGR